MKKQHTNIPSDIKDYVLGVAHGGDYYDCVDNIRIAEKGNRESEQAYEVSKEQGCCGFVDYILVPFLSDGKEYYYGFNHGH